MFLSLYSGRHDAPFGADGADLARCGCPSATAAPDRSRATSRPGHRADQVERPRARSREVCN